MKDIRFRVWMETFNKMLYSDTFSLNGETRKFLQLQLFFQELDLDENLSEPMIFAGMYDDEEIPIYEGDIVQFEWIEDEVAMGEVKFGEFNVEGGANTYPGIYGFYVEYNIRNERNLNGIAYGFEEALHDLESVKVLGNIYEDPKMLYFW